MEIFHKWQSKWHQVYYWPLPPLPQTILCSNIRVIMLLHCYYSGSTLQLWAQKKCDTWSQRWTWLPESASLKETPLCLVASDTGSTLCWRRGCRSGSPVEYKQIQSASMFQHIPGQGGLSFTTQIVFSKLSFFSPVCINIEYWNRIFFFFYTVDCV